MHRLIIGLVALTFACGDGLVESGYRGQPLYEFSGRVTSVGGQIESGMQLRAAVFWSPAGDTVLSEDLVEQQSISVDVEFPGTFAINVFEPPPDVAWRTSSEVRVGLVLVYEDINGDGHAQVGERRGGASHTVLLYAEDAVPGSRSPTGRALAAGYHAERVPMPCEPQEAHEGGENCGVTLGSACATDSDCGGDGVCLHQDRYFFWPGGYCVVLESACPTGDGVARLTSIGGVEGRFLHARCDSGDNCRLAEGYTCNDQVCEPGEPAALVIAPDFAVANLCVEEDGGGDEED